MDLNGGRAAILIIWERGGSCIPDQCLLLLLALDGASETSLGIFMLNHSDKMFLFYSRFKKDLKLFLNSTFRFFTKVIVLVWC